MSKYKKQVQEMLEAHKDIFTAFKGIHDKYVLDPKKWQKLFNEEGQQVQIIIQRWENNLCAKSEGGKYGKFSGNLSDKFRSEVRQLFPKIDYIGMNHS